MLKIGLTGGIGSGKSTAAKFFAELGVEVIDADNIVHELLLPGVESYEEIVKHFGSKILIKNKELNCKLLREIIFNNVRERKWLEELLHPMVFAIMQKRANVSKSPYCILVIPLLFEANAEYLVDRILVIESSKANQISRSKKRDHSEADEIEKIISSQIASEIRIKKADDIIYNNGNFNELKEQILKLHQQYLRFAKMQ